MKPVSAIKAIRKGDKDFMIKSGVISSPRAGFEIMLQCPSEYKNIIQECIRLGWLKPVAFMHSEELMWEKLRG